jgi:hypothetical protein
MQKVVFGHCRRVFGSGIKRGDCKTISQPIQSESTQNVSPYTFIVVVYPQFRQTYGMMMTISLALYLSTPTFTLSKSSIIFVVLPALGQLK